MRPQLHDSRTPARTRLDKESPATFCENVSNPGESTAISAVNVIADALVGPVLGHRADVFLNDVIRHAGFITSRARFRWRVEQSLVIEPIPAFFGLKPDGLDFKPLELPNEPADKTADSVLVGWPEDGILTLHLSADFIPSIFQRLIFTRQPAVGHLGQGDARLRVEIVRLKMPEKIALLDRLHPPGKHFAALRWEQLMGWRGRRLARPLAHASPKAPDLLRRSAHFSEADSILTSFKLVGLSTISDSWRSVK